MLFLFNTIKSIFKLGALFFKILSIVASLFFIWFVFNYLNNKMGIFTPIVSILKSVYKGIRGAFSLIGF